MRVTDVLPVAGQGGAGVVKELVGVRLDGLGTGGFVTGYGITVVILGGVVGCKSHMHCWS